MSTLPAECKIITEEWTKTTPILKKFDTFKLNRKLYIL